MTTYKEITETNFNKAIELGIYEVLEYNKEFTKVRYYKACLRTEDFNVKIVK